jgi:hypothetical protein
MGSLHGDERVQVMVEIGGMPQRGICAQGVGVLAAGVGQSAS